MVDPVKTEDSSAAARLQALLERELLSGTWAEGARLPTERALSETYGVARNTLRRALDGLERAGLVERHVGRGTFRRTAPPPAALEEEALSPAAVMECRLLLEPELIGLAVLRATPADLARIQACLRGTDEAASLAEFEHWDAALHDAFAVATHNAAVLGMSRSLARVRERTDWGALKARGDTPAHRARLQAQHHEMVEALQRRDRDRARLVMRAHLLLIQAVMAGE
ncbi:FadR/GntR family transcriptional regulator [Pseudoroseomonas cervicalis]|uniref:FadR/GntR family transcriptional regulator n=1 Tax=Teichococcus cervicalis TaxID=204525 RepID=UPI00277D2CFD|nr:FCD domain-containing protein [Pseudoroseomonas cervicalis]MDQ1079606.1 DNA-binding FadR family transcriptional regulator [Pseudoroseomonas cervicalis]